MGKSKEKDKKENLTEKRRICGFPSSKWSDFAARFKGKLAIKKADKSKMGDTKQSFQKLTPITDADLGIYADAIDCVFQSKNYDIRNIAVTGDYGSGKSSLIKSYEKLKKKRFIYISLAHFESKIAGDNDGRLSEEYLEKKIINHLLQQVNKRAIRGTSLRTKEKVNKPFLALVSFSTLFAIACGLYLRFSESIKGYIESTDLKNYGLLNSQYLTLWVASALAIVVFFMLFGSFIWIKRRHWIKKVVVKDVEFQFNEANGEKSFFNLNLDEILYVLEAITVSAFFRRVDAIIFEDLDRYEDGVNSVILERLRELCILGNNRIRRNHLFNKRPLRFFYLLKDETFTSMDRTKFFDYIIPVIPIVDPLNSLEKMNTCFMENGINGRINRHFLRKLSLYFNDYRLIKNIINEFLIYSNKLSNTEHDDNILFAMVVYKNFFPQDFAALQRNEGYVFSLFEKKNEQAEKEKKSIDNIIQAFNSRLIMLDEERLTDAKELDLVAADRKRYPSDYKDKEYDKWINDEYEVRKSIIDDRKKEEEIRQKISNLQREKIRINNQKLSKYASGKNSDKFFDVKKIIDGKDIYREIKDDKNFDLIKYLIISGYLDDASYRDYMACFEEGGISISDKNFLMGLTIGSGKAPDYELKSPAVVFESLSPKDFLSPESRNYQLIDYIFRNNKKEAIESFVIQLMDDMDYGFICNYLRRTREYEKVIVSFCRRWPGFLAALVSRDNREMEGLEKQRIVITALLNCDTDIILTQNEGGILSDYLSKDTLDMECKESLIEDLIVQMKNLNVKLESLWDQTGSPELRNAFIRNDLYEINEENLELLLSDEKVATKDKRAIKTMTRLLKPRTRIWYLYIRDNLQRTLETITKSDVKKPFEDDEDIVIDIVNSSIDEESINQYISRSNTVLSDIKSVPTIYWSAFAKKHAFEEKGENISAFYNQFGMNDVLINYLNDMYDIEGTLTTLDESTQVRLWNDTYQKDSLNDGIYGRIVSTIGKEVKRVAGLSIASEKCRILINAGLVPLTGNNLAYIRTNYPSTVQDYACSNITNYIGLNPYSNSIDKREAQGLLEDTRISDDDKINVLYRTDGDISVIGMAISDPVFCEVLYKHFDKNDMKYLADSYETFNDNRKTAILEKIMSDIPTFTSVCGKASQELLIRVFERGDIALTAKAELIDELLCSNRPNASVKELLEVMGEKGLSRLFESDHGNNRIRINYLDVDQGHTKLLDVLQKHMKISGYREVNGKYRVDRRF